MILVALLVRLMEDFVYVVSGIVSRLAQLTPMPRRVRQFILRRLRPVRMQQSMLDYRPTHLLRNGVKLVKDEICSEALLVDHWPVWILRCLLQDFLQTVGDIALQFMRDCSTTLKANPEIHVTHLCEQWIGGTFMGKAAHISNISQCHMILQLVSQGFAPTDAIAFTGWEKVYHQHHWNSSLAFAMIHENGFVDVWAIHAMLCCAEMPTGPLPSWACLSTKDVQIGDGMCVPAGMITMVNMWSIMHDPHIWESPERFRLERFIV
eukprot:Gb_23504 [translate_table: standard]